MKRANITAFALLFMIAGASTVASAQDDHNHGREHDKGPPPGQARKAQVSAAEQQQRLQEQQQRAEQYRQRLDQQVQANKSQAAQIEMQRHAAQYRLQQQYNAQIQQQQARLRTPRNYANDPYITAPRRYRYSFGGTTHLTNEYGAQMLRSAVNNGYSQGYRAGQADHQDRWASNYQNSIAYRDGIYGYSGDYIDQSDYSYYFRQGFQRGYQDGYNSRYQYGSYSSGSYSVLGNVLNGILGLVSIQ